tara:strand:- start:4042 stop:4251 length:210 start_codon:yes stop_codon:yes gene_type:complete
MSDKEDALKIALIVCAETGESIEMGDLPAIWYPKLAKAMVQMFGELQEYRKRPDPANYDDLFYDYNENS